MLKGRRVLLTEDNNINAEIATELLSDEGLIIERAKDGVECVEMLEKAPDGYYDIILMDIQMPIMNGYEAATKIRRIDDPEKANIPIIALTANAFSEDKDNAIKAGMNDHVPKPIDMNVIEYELSKLVTPDGKRLLYGQRTVFADFKQQYLFFLARIGVDIYEHLPAVGRSTVKFIAIKFVRTGRRHYRKRGICYDKLG